MLVLRRELLRSAMGLAAGGTAPAFAAEGRGSAVAKPAPGLKHRAYSGKVLYITEGKGEMGRERFTVTVQPNGLRTLRAMCEMDDDQLLRDVVSTVDGEWRPQVAFVQLTVQQQFQGATWYHFSNHLAECAGVTVQQGRFAQSFTLDEAADSFGTHPVHNDAWALARIRRAKGNTADMQIAAFTTSTLPNGGSGPALIPLAKGFSKLEVLGPEKVKVPAGTFTAEHFRFTIAHTDDALDIWSMGEDCIPVRLSSSHLKQYYELVELTGDPR